MRRDTVGHYAQIANKIFDALDFTPLDQIFGTAPKGVTPGHLRVDAILEDVRLRAEEFTIGELIMYLRTCYSSSNELVNWKPLLERARELASEEELQTAFRGLDRPYRRSFPV